MQQGNVIFQMFTAQQATRTSEAFKCDGYTAITIYMRTTGNPGAGTLIIEESASLDHGSTWSQIASIDIDATVGTSSEVGYHIGGPGGQYSFGYVRVRLTVAVTVATLDVYLKAA